MDLKVLKDFIDLAKKEGVAELKYEGKDIKLSVNFNANPSMANYAPITPVVQSAQKTETPQSTSQYHEVKSPFVGTFYSSPGPDKPRFVNIGDKVTKGQTLCILEAMKIMNEIEADKAGEIVEICVENESLVEYGQVLFKIK